jgi:hypothetical protein
MVAKKAELVLATEAQPELPPIMVGRATPAVAAQVRDFYESVAQTLSLRAGFRCETSPKATAGGRHAAVAMNAE